jgi:hypothetical protein
VGKLLFAYPIAYLLLQLLGGSVLPPPLGLFLQQLQPLLGSQTVVQLHQQPGQVAEGCDPGLQAHAVGDQLEDRPNEGVRHNGVEVAEFLPAKVLGHRLGGGGAILLLALHLAHAQVVPALQVAVGQAALGKAGEQLRLELVPLATRTIRPRSPPKCSRRRGRPGRGPAWRQEGIRSAGFA